MKRVPIMVAIIAALAGCRPAVPPEVLKSYQGRTLSTCCNIHHEGETFSDANYYVGAMIPAGTPAQVQSGVRNGVSVLVGGTRLTLSQDYGREQESFQQYLDKILVADDPKLRIEHFSRDVQQAIRVGRVEKGMTKEQVLLSLGYPPTHRTASTTANDWLYWYNKWVTYRVSFDDKGKVSNVVGHPAPTQDQPIQEAPPPRPAAPAKKRHK